MSHVADVGLSLFEQVVALYRGIPAHFSSLLLSSITRDGRIKTKNRWRIV